MIEAEDSEDDDSAGELGGEIVFSGEELEVKMVEVEGEDVDEAKKKREERHKEKRDGSCHTAHYVRRDIHSYVHVYVYVLYHFHVHDHVVYFFRCYCCYYYHH